MNPVQFISSNLGRTLTNRTLAKIIRSKFNKEIGRLGSLPGFGMSIMLGTIHSGWQGIIL